MAFLERIRSHPAQLAVALTVVVGLLGVIAAVAGAEDAAAGTGAPTTAPTVTVPAATTAPAGIAFVPPGGADLASGPDRDVFMTIHEGISLPFLHRSGDWLLVTTTCNDTAWVDASDVAVTPQHQAAPTGPGFDIGTAVVVLDPGHGDRDWGGVGPTGLTEKEVNLDIAERVKGLMESARSVDWTTGAISSGTEIPAFGSVVLTRDATGPADGDFEAGLGYRATVATAAGADVFVSIHNNTVPRTDVEIPGSEVYYSVGAAESDRLAGLVYEELLGAFEQFTADWRGGDLLGPRARVDPATGLDYYGVLRRATMPAVIAEGLYISEPDEEAIMKTEAFRDAYAGAVYRAIVRFLTTNDDGAAVHDPEPFTDDAGTVSGSGCVVPVQP
jgi:N-acetylmuramoyl-L-alanine amidase